MSFVSKYQARRAARMAERRAAEYREIAALVSKIADDPTRYFMETSDDISLSASIAMSLISTLLHMDPENAKRIMNSHERFSDKIVDAVTLNFILRR